MDELSAQRLGNQQRAEWRTKCRRLLSEHLHPEAVRLKPEPHDDYRWTALPNKEHLFPKHLFTKQLSKHSVGVYMELCREVGASFEAARGPSGENHDEHQVAEFSTTEDNFLLIIAQLNEEIVGLKDALQQRSQEIKQSLEAAGRWEQTSQNLETDLHDMRVELEHARQHKYRLARTVRYLAKKDKISQREVSKALVTLRKLEQGMRCHESASLFGFDLENEVGLRKRSKHAFPHNENHP